MSEEVLVAQRKKKRTKSLFGQPSTEENEERYSTSDEGDSGVIAREFSVAMREEVKKVTEQMKVQEKVFHLENRKLDERSFTARNALTNSELGNVAKVFLSDQSVTLGKGTQTERKHRKIFGPLYHSDHETSVVIELRRSEEQ
jgi:hypothetical protein